MNRLKTGIKFVEEARGGTAGERKGESLTTFGGTTRAVEGDKRGKSLQASFAEEVKRIQKAKVGAKLQRRDVEARISARIERRSR